MSQQLAPRVWLITGAGRGFGRLFAEAARRRPGDAVPRYHRAVALTELGRWAEAAQEYEAALRLHPSPDVAAASRQGLDGVRSLMRTAPPRRGAAEETASTRARASRPSHPVSRKISTSDPSAARP